MKTLTKTRFRNRYIIGDAVVLFLFTVLSWLLGSGIVSCFFQYSEDVRQQFTYWEYIGHMLDQLLCWEFCIDSAMRYIGLIFPVFCCIPILHFAEEWKGYYIFGSVRFTNYRKEVIWGVMVHSLIAGLTVIIPLLVFITLVRYLMYPSIDNIGGLVSAFPSNFYSQHPYLTFVFMIAVLYLLLSISYALMGCGILLLTENKMLIILLPFVLYTLENYVSQLHNGILPISTLEVVAAYNTLVKTEQLFVPIVVNYVAALTLIIAGIMVQEKKEIRG